MFNFFRIDVEKTTTEINGRKANITTYRHVDSNEYHYVAKIGWKTLYGDDFSTSKAAFEAAEIATTQYLMKKLTKKQRK